MRAVCFIAPEAEHTHSGDEDDGWVSASHRGGTSRRVALVVGAVLNPVLLVQLAQASDDVVERGVRRQVEHHRSNLGPQEVVGARGALHGELGVTFAS